MVSSVLQSRIDLACQAVQAQAELLHREFGRALSEWKSDGTRVTPVDLEISAAIMEGVREAFPEDQFFSEELAHVGDPIPVTSRYTWVLDPIDGTNNYAKGLAHCAIALALLDEGVPIYGVIYDLSRHKLMRGGPKLGVWDGAERVSLGRSDQDGQALIGFHSPVDRRYAPHAEKLIERYKIRALGSSTLHLAYVAAGILDGVVDHNVKLWDIAAAVPMVWAVGGETLWMNGNPFPVKRFDLKMERIFYVAGSPSMCARMQRTLSE